MQTRFWMTRFRVYPTRFRLHSTWLHTAHCFLLHDTVAHGGLTSRHSFTTLSCVSTPLGHGWTQSIPGTSLNQAFGPYCARDPGLLRQFPILFKQNTFNHKTNLTQASTQKCSAPLRLEAGMKEKPEQCCASLCHGSRSHLPIPVSSSNCLQTQYFPTSKIRKIGLNMCFLESNKSCRCMSAYSNHVISSVLRFRRRQV